MASAAVVRELDTMTKESSYGSLSVYADGNGMNAVVFNVDSQKIVKRFKNKETAWSDADRWADDNFRTDYRP